MKQKQRFKQKTFSAAHKTSALLRFGLADLLKMDVESKEFEAVAKHIPKDRNWDETNVIEAAYKKAELDRHSVSDLKGMTTTTQSSTFEEAMASAKTGTSKSGLGEAMILDVKAGTSICKYWKSKPHVLEQGKKTLEKELMSMEDTVLNMLNKGKVSSSSAHLNQKAEDCKTRALPNLQKTLADVRSKLASYNMAEVEKVEEKQLTELTDLIETASTFADVANS